MNNKVVLIKLIDKKIRIYPVSTQDLFDNKDLNCQKMVKTISIIITIDVDTNETDEVKNYFGAVSCGITRITTIANVKNSKTPLSFSTKF